MTPIQQPSTNAVCTQSPIPEELRVTKLDGLVLTLLALGTFVLSYAASLQLHPVLFNDSLAKNLLFDSDPARVVEVMTTRLSAFHRFSFTHPLFSLIAYPPVYLLKIVVGMEPLSAVRIVISAVAAVWASSLLVALRLIGCRRVDALLFTLLGMSSSSAMLWLVVPESYSFGSVTILWVVALCAVARYRPLSPAWYVIASAVSLSVTVTNWMAGLLATILQHPWRRAVQITANAFCLVVVLWIAEKIVFPSSQFFVAHWDPSGFMFTPEAGGIVRILKVLLLDSLIFPTINEIRWVSEPLPGLSVQASQPGSASAWGAIGLVCWCVLLGWGLVGLASRGGNVRFRLFFGLTLLGQLSLYTVFGRETFLYSLNVAPLLVLLAARSTLTRGRSIAVFMAAVVTVSAIVNNSVQFERITNQVHARAPSGQ